MSEFIYIVVCDRFVKVGITGNVKRRMSTFQTSNPHELKLFDFFEIPAGYSARIIEKMAHEKLTRQGFHHKLEWFCGLNPEKVRELVIECIYKSSISSLINSIKIRISSKNKNIKRFSSFVESEKTINKSNGNKNMTLEQVKKALQNYKLNRVAKAAGVDRHVLYRMMKEDAKPTYETVKKLSDWLEGPQQ